MRSNTSSKGKKVKHSCIIQVIFFTRYLCSPIPSWEASWLFQQVQNKSPSPLGGITRVLKFWLRNKLLKKKLYYPQYPSFMQFGAQKFKILLNHGVSVYKI